MLLGDTCQFPFQPPGHDWANSPVLKLHIPCTKRVLASAKAPRKLQYRTSGPADPRHRVRFEIVTETTLPITAPCLNSQGRGRLRIRGSFTSRDKTSTRSNQYEQPMVRPNNIHLCLPLGSIDHRHLQKSMTNIFPCSMYYIVSAVTFLALTFPGVDLSKKMARA